MSYLYDPNKDNRKRKKSEKSGRGGETGSMFGSFFKKGERIKGKKRSKTPEGGVRKMKFNK